MFQGIRSRMQETHNALSENAQALSQSAVGSVSRFFKSGKRRREGNVSGGGGGEDAGVQHYAAESPFTEPQTDWLADVVGESIQHSLTEFGFKFGSKIEQRFIEAEKRINALEDAADTSA